MNSVRSRHFFWGTGEGLKPARARLVSMHSGASLFYQSAARLTYRLNSYINEMALYDGGGLGAIRINSADIRVLSLAIPKGSVTVAQRAGIEAARVRAQAFGVDLVVTPF
jgi:hypothetical protein